MARAALLLLPLLLACGPKKATTGLDPDVLLGTWTADNGGTATVELVGGEPTFTSLVDYDGEVFQVQSSEWGDGVFEWTYLVPSTGYIVHEVVTSADRGSLCTIWSNQNDRGTSCYTR